MDELEQMAERITKRVMKTIGPIALKCTRRNLKAQILDELEKIKKEKEPLRNEDGTSPFAC